MTETARQLSIFEPAYPEMTAIEESVWKEIQHHPGQHTAIRLSSLVEITGIPERAVRSALKNLVEVYGMLVGSTSTNPPGYFLIQTPEELEDVCRRYNGYGLSMLRRSSRLRGIALSELFGQLQLQAQEIERGHAQPA